MATPAERDSDVPPQQHHTASSRRQILCSIPVAGVLLLAQQAVAAEQDGLVDLVEKQLPGLPLPPPDLPKPYQRTMHKLVKALRESIEAEAAGAKEFEVRG